MPILTPEERLGSRIAGKYRLDSLLGRGGVGVVFRATHEWTGREVAIKLLAPERTDDATIVRRFLQEARAAAQLKHPNVVDVLDMDTDADGTVYLALELLEGETLAALLERRGTLDAAEALGIALPVMDALERAHQIGIVHRDLKPENIILTAGPDGRIAPKVVDFGVAKMKDTIASNTSTGALIGTPFYMSPEQARGHKDVGPATDVWAIAVLLYRALAGGLPFTAPTPVGVLMAIVQEPPVPLTTAAPSAPRAVAGVVDRALHKEISDRFETMEALAEALGRAAAEDGIEPRAPSASVLSPLPAASRTPRAPPETPVGLRAKMQPGKEREVPARRARLATALAIALAVVLAAGLAAWGAGVSFGGATPPPRLRPPRDVALERPAAIETPAAGPEPIAAPAIAPEPPQKRVRSRRHVRRTERGPNNAPIIQ